MNPPGSAGLQPGNDRKQAEQELGAPGELSASRPPNHVHVLIHPLQRLSGIVQSWKSFTGRWALAHNAELELGVPGKVFWMREYWDRFIRNENHLQQTIAYIHLNPVKAGLCASLLLWHWSGAHHGIAKEPARTA